MELVQKVTTDLSFVDGVLVPAGTLVTIPASIKPGANLADVGQTPMAIPVAVAAIGPTGPNPTMPQQVPPGVFQGVGGYTAPGGALLVAEGSEAARLVAEQGLTIADDDMPIRHGAEATGDATTAATGGGLGALSGGLSDDERKELEQLRAERAEAARAVQMSDEYRAQKAAQASGDFDAGKAIEGNVPDVTERVKSMTAEQLDAVEQAELAGSSRSGVQKAIDDRRAELDDDI